jgi:fibronectin-binding autotransporter adhesin
MRDCYSCRDRHRTKRFPGTRITRTSVVVASVACLVLWRDCGELPAAVYTYTPVASTTDLWSTGNDWNAIPVSGATSALVFVGSNETVLANGLVNTSTDDISGTFLLNSLSLRGTGPAEGAATITISGSTSSNVLRFTGSNPVVNLDALDGQGGLTYNVNVNISLGTATTFQGNGTADFVFGGDFLSGGALIKNGSCTLILAGANSSYTGITTINAGVLQLGDGTSRNGSIGTIVNNAALVFANPFDQTFSRAISGTGSLTKTGAGVLSLSTTTSFTGDTRISCGTLRLSSTSALGGSTLDYSGYGGTLSFGTGTSRTLGGLKGNQDLALANDSGAAVALTVGGNNQSTTYSGVLSGPGSLIKTGTGTMTLTGTASYSGNTTISAGTLQLGDGMHDATFAGDVAGYGSLVFANVNDLVYAGSITGGVSLTKSGTGLLTLFGSSSFSGSTKITVGTLRLASSTALGASVLDYAGYGGTLSFGQTTSQTLGGLSGDQDLALANDNGEAVNLTIAGRSDCPIYSGQLSGPGGLTISSGGLDLRGTNTYTGGTILNGGRLRLAIAAALPAGTLTVSAASQIDNSSDGPITLANNPIALNANLTFNGSQDMSLGNNSLTLGADSTITVSSKTLTIPGPISGEHSLTKAGGGTLTLSGNNTYSGGTTLSGGTLRIGSDSAIPSGPLTISGASTIDNTSGAPITLPDNPQAWNANLSFGGSGDLNLGNGPVTLGADAVVTVSGATLTIGGPISGNHSLTYYGSGALVLGGTNNCTGGLTLVGCAVTLANAAALPSGPLTFNTCKINNATGAPIVLAQNPEIRLGSLQYNGPNDLDLGDGDVTLTSNATLTIVDAAARIGGPIAGNYSLTKSGNGTLTLASANTYTGSTTVSGTLVLGNSLALQNSFLIANGKVLFGTLTEATTGGLGGSGQLSLTNDSSQPVALTVGGTATSTFSGSLRGAGSLTITGSGALTLSGTNTFAGDLTVSGGALTLSGPNSHAGRTRVLGGTLTISNYKALQYSTLDNTGGTVTFYSACWPVTIGGLSGNRDLNFYDAAYGDGDFVTVGGNNESTTFSGALIGAPTQNAGQLTKTGTGTLTILNQVSVPLVIDSGAVQIGDGVTSCAVTADITNNALLTINNAADQAYSKVLSGTGSFVKDGPGTLAITRQNTFSGNTTIRGGVLQLAGQYALTGSMVDCSGGTLGFAGTISQEIAGILGSRDLTLTSTTGAGIALTVGSNDLSTTFTGAILGAGTLTKSGTGTLTLTNPGTTATISTNNGVLAIGTPNALQNATLNFQYATGSVSLSNLDSVSIGGLAGWGTLTLTNTSGQPIALAVGSNNRDSQCYTTITGLGGLTKVGAGCLSLQYPGSFTGDTRICSGTLSLPGSGQSALRGSTLDMNATDTGVLALSDLGSVELGGLKGQRSLPLSGWVVVGLNNQSTTYSGVLSGTGKLTKMGSGVLTLTGANTYTGDTWISAGTLNVGDGSGLPAASTIGFSGIVPDLPILETSGDIVRDISKVSWSGRGGFAAKGAPVHVRFTKNGSATTLSLASDSNLLLSSATADNVVDLQNPIRFLQNQSVYVLDNPNVTTDYAVLSGSITGSGGFAKDGPGRLVISGHSNYTGVTSILAGTLELGVDNSLPALTDMLLDGGIFATAGFDQTNRIGALTLADDSTIDLGQAIDSVLLFGDSHAKSWLGTLDILSWNGAFDGGGSEQLVFGSSSSALSDSQLGKIVFVNPCGRQGSFPAAILATGEIVPAPEPGSAVLLGVAAMLLASLALRRAGKRK